MILAALPWIVIVVVLVEFALVDELPAPVVRRAVIGASLGLVVLTLAVTAGGSSGSGPRHLLTAAGPLAFLALHSALRLAFKRLKQGEPVLLFTPEAHQGRTRRHFFQPDAHRRVSGWDYPYSLLVGMALLVSVAPAIAELIERSP